jgi:hypothetical protein
MLIAKISAANQTPRDHVFWLSHRWLRGVNDCSIGPEAPVPGELYGHLAQPRLSSE